MSQTVSMAVKVAVVEDDPDDMNFLCRRLAKIPALEVVGCHVTAEDALKLVPAARPTLVLMDIMLPGINGIQCTRRLKRLLPGLRVVMVTSLQDQATFGDALRNGADGYLTKPVSQAELLAAMRKALTGLPPISETMMTHLVELARRAPARFKPHARLTKRENEVLRQLVAGHSDKEIAASIEVTPATIHSHLHNIYRKLGVGTRAQAVARCRDR